MHVLIPWEHVRRTRRRALPRFLNLFVSARILDKRRVYGLQGACALGFGHVHVLSRCWGGNVLVFVIDKL